MALSCPESALPTTPPYAHEYTADGEALWRVGVPSTNAKRVRMLPYQGPRFYSRLACKYLLRHGICTWSDLSLGFTATAHLALDFFRAPLDAIEQGIAPTLAIRRICYSRAGSCSCGAVAGRGANV